MEQAKQIEIVTELMRQVDTGKNVDAGVQYRVPLSIYADEDLAKEEWDKFFKNHPQLIGFSDALPEPNSFITINDFGVPVLATRDKEGRFRAFLNACRHRAAQVECEERGTRKLFVCPFHAWSYSTAGDLVAIADEDQFGDVDKSCSGLVELPAEEAGGMLFVHPNPEGELDVEKLLGADLLEEMASNNFGDFVYGGNKTLDMKLNWKLANDTFGETYHFQKLHKNTLGQIFLGNNTHLEEFGQHHRFCTANIGLAHMREQKPEEWQIQTGTFVGYHLFPNIQIFWSGDSFFLIRIYPHKEGPGRSVTQVTAYFTKEAYAQAMAADEAQKKQAMEQLYDPDREERIPSIEASLEIFNSTIRDEDYVMGENQQAAAESGIAKDSIFGRNEPVLHSMHRAWRDALGRPHFERIEP